MEDNDIVKLFLRRNESALCETEKKYGKYCFSIANNILKNVQDAKESVNDTLMSAWNCIPPHQPEILSVFLGKITRYLALKKLRDKKAKKRGGSEVDLVYEELSEQISSKENIEEKFEEKELAIILNAFLYSLSKEERRVFVCRYWYFESIKTISKTFGYSESKVKSMLYRVRNKLLYKLKEEGVLIEK